MANQGMVKTLDSVIAALNNKVDGDVIDTKISTQVSTAVNDAKADVVDLTSNQTIGGIKKFTSYNTTTNAFETNQNLSGTNIDCSVASTFTKTISANTTFTISGVPSGMVSTICLLLTNGGSYTVTWPANVKWPSATVPTLSTGTDLITLLTPDGGTTWYGTLSMTELG